MSSPLRQAARLVRRAAAACLVAVVAAPAAAQVVTAGYGPTCVPGPACIVRFTIANPSSTTLLLNTLTLTSGTDAHAFGVGTAGLYSAADSYEPIFGPFSGATDLRAGGSAVFVDFLEGGAPPFTLFARERGYVEVNVLVADRSAPFAFTFAATLADGRSVSGAVATVPEPATIVLTAAGLAALAALRRRRVPSA